MLGFALSDGAILMILYDFCLLPAAQVVKNIPTLMEIFRFITVFTRANEKIISSAS
jgi:hypothetical protein